MLGTLTQILACEDEAFQLSIQNGSCVTPSLAVTRRSAPPLFAAPKFVSLPRWMFTWNCESAVPLGLLIVTGLRYNQAGSIQPAFCACAGRMTIRQSAIAKSSVFFIVLLPVVRKLALSSTQRLACDVPFVLIVRPGIVHAKDVQEIALPHAASLPAVIAAEEIAC